VFEARIAQGILTASFISTAQETKLPGPRCIYLRQDLRFLAPVHPSNTEHAQITITDVNPDKKRIFAHTGYRVGDTPAIVGDATLFVAQRRKAI